MESAAAREVQKVRSGRRLLLDGEKPPWNAVIVHSPTFDPIEHYCSASENPRFLTACIRDSHFTAAPGNRDQIVPARDLEERIYDFSDRHRVIETSSDEH